MNSLKTRKHSHTSPTLRQGFFYALIILVSSPLLAEPTQPSSSGPLIISGQTAETSGKPIPYVSIISISANILILSDERGYFSYSGILIPDDSIRIQRIGYQTRTIPAKEFSRLATIRLTPIVLSLGSVEIIAVSTSNTIDILKPLAEYSQTVSTRNMDHSKMLRRIPGLTIKSYGGPAGIGSLSVDGGPSSHTKVTLDGIDLTSAQNGEADISQLPLPFVRRMTYLPYDISHSGSGGSDGIVRLESGVQKNQLSMSSGSFGHFAYDINLNKHILGFWTSIQFGKRQEVGNYNVQWNEATFPRQNNGLNQQFAALTTKRFFRPDLFWQFNALATVQSRGVAGLLWSPDSLSHRDDELNLLGTTLTWIQLNGSTHFKLSRRNSHEIYYNSQLNTKSDHQLSTTQLMIKHKQTIGKWIELLSDFAIDQDWISSDETGEHHRQNYSATITPELSCFTHVIFSPTLKYLASPGLYEELLTDLQIQLPLNWGPLQNLALSRGDVYRYPSFNDQFWWPGGNPNLLPEETGVATAQLEFDISIFGNLMLQWQRKESTNLIQWMPGFFYWHPENVSSATRESRKIIWQLNKPEWNITSFAHLSLISTRDQDLNRTLRYAPKQTSAVGLSWSPQNYELNIQYNYISDQISMYDFPVNTSVKSTELWSMGLSRSWLSRFGQIDLVLSGENLLDKQFETIRGYPEPGRSLKISTTCTPKQIFKRN